MHRRVGTPEGLPLPLEVFAGHRTGVATVEAIFGRKEERVGHARWVWGIVPGRVREKNLHFLCRRGALFVLGTPQSGWQDFAGAQTEEGNWTEGEGEVEASRVDPPTTTPTSASQNAAATAGRPGTDPARRGEGPLERGTSQGRAVPAPPASGREQTGRTAHRPLAGALSGGGPLEGDETRFRLRRKDLRAAAVPPTARAGPSRPPRGETSLPRLPCTEADPARRWRWYSQLTQAEATYRTAKSDTGRRPVDPRRPTAGKPTSSSAFSVGPSGGPSSRGGVAGGLGARAAKRVESIAALRSTDLVVPWQ
jgi:hypothetical protein